MNSSEFLGDSTGRLGRRLGDRGDWVRAASGGMNLGGVCLILGEIHGVEFVVMIWLIFYHGFISRRGGRGSCVRRGLEEIVSDGFVYEFGKYFSVESILQ